MKLTPTLILAFANDQDQYLYQLKRESQGIEKTLRELDRKSFIKVVREESAETEDIYSQLISHQAETVIFHYGGHAGGTMLQLEDLGGDIKGLAPLLGSLLELKLVFLNGCSTYGQVEYLFEQGVPAVLATTVPIEDKKAVEFSIAFYEALANRLSIRQSYKMAVARLNLAYGNLLVDDIQLFRGFKEEKGQQEKIPWGLYLREGEEIVLDYQLPIYRQLSIPQEVFSSISRSFPANKFILRVLESMCQSNPDIYHEMVEQRGDQLLNKDPKDFPILIIRNFPWPVGAQIRLLHQKTSPGLERFKCLLSTYVVTTQLLYYFLLSDIWGHQHSQKIQLANRQYFQWDKQTFLHQDFLLAFEELFTLISNNQNYILSIQELGDIYKKLQDKDSGFYRAWQYLEKVKKNFHEQTLDDHWDKHCLNAERALEAILKAVAFLARFQMMTVRNVMVENPRFEQLVYELDMGPLNASESVHLRLYQDHDRRVKSNFSNCKSVVLVADENAMHQSLNLSPFIMDANTFAQVKNSQTTSDDVDNVANIFILGWQEDNRLIYIKTDHDLFTAIENRHKTDLIHTDLRQSDFDEGTNLEEEEELFDFTDDERKLEEDSPKVFELLKRQFDLFKAEMEGSIER